MFVRTSYWYFKNAVDNFFINSLNEAVKKQETIRGKIDGKKVDSKRRESDVKFISEQWIYDALLPYIRTANQSAKWNYDFDYCEAAQYTIYKKGQHYQWHRDIYPPEVDGPYPGLIRKLSMVVQLSNFEDYKGGMMILMTQRI